MSGSRRLCFNFEEIFNDHRKLCYLFVDAAKYKSVNDFKVHVQSGFGVNKCVYFSDKDGVLFPDFDDIRTLIDYNDVIWVRKINDLSSSGSLQEEDQKSAQIENISKNKENGHSTDSYFSEHSNSIYEKKDFKIKKKKTKKKLKIYCEEKKLKKKKINLSDQNSVDSLKSLSSKNIEKSVYNSIDDAILCIEGDISVIKNENIGSTSDFILSGNKCEDKNFNDSDYSIRINKYSPQRLDSEKISKHECTDDADLLGNFVNSNLPVDNYNNKAELKIKNVSEGSVCEIGKRKRKRKRVRKNKSKDKDKICNSDLYYGNSKVNNIKNDEKADKVLDSFPKHLRFESDFEDGVSYSNTSKISNSDSYEKVSKSLIPSGLNDESNCDSQIQLQLEDSNCSSISDKNQNRQEVVNEGNCENIMENSSKFCGKKENQGKLKLHCDSRNEYLKKGSEKKWDQKHESSEIVFDELLKLKQLVKNNSYFKSPVFNRTPKVNVKKCDVLEHTEGDSSSNKFNTETQDDACKNNGVMEGVSLIVDDIVNFKVLFLSQDYTPTISESILGRVVSVNNEELQLKILLGNDICKPLSGKFSFIDDSENGEDSDIIKLHVKDLISPKKIINPFSVLNNSNN